MENGALRETYLKKRLEFKNREELDEKIALNLFLWPEYARGRVIGIYSPIKNEINTLMIFERAKKDHKRICFPRVENSGGLSFFTVDSLALLQKGTYGVNEPAESLPKIERSEIDLIIVPALCYNCNGYRLGYGKGCYDRFLKGYRGITAGLVYNSFIVDNLVAEPHDVAINYLVTETGVFKTEA